MSVPFTVQDTFLHSWNWGNRDGYRKISLPRGILRLWEQVDLSKGGSRKGWKQRRNLGKCLHWGAEAERGASEGQVIRKEGEPGGRSAMEAPGETYHQGGARHGREVQRLLTNCVQPLDVATGS